PAPSQTLQNVSYWDQPWTAADDAAIAKVVDNLMVKLGAQTDAFAIGDAMNIFSQNGNWAALDAATDYLTAQQKTDLGYSPAPGQALQNIAYWDQPWTNADDVEIAGQARDLVLKLGANIDDFALSDAASIFANNLNANGVDAVIGELSSTQLNNILPFISADLSNAGITLGTQSANTYNGTSGADKYLGLGGNDTLYGNNGNDELFGDAGADKLYGGNNDDLLVGGTGNDNLYGESGNDTLLGGKGTDNLYGGIGADLFVFDGADVGTGADRIKDFSLSQGDRIDISDVLDQYDPATDSLSQFVRLTTSGANTLLQVDVNGTESGGFTTIATIENVTGLDLNALVNNGTILV
ncbi:MAG: type I secretion C-terminal target domain-containing protein, partial [Alphaproteobacteria bacterium]|nr:type I secretion C-terminal target domain-containing protein [Alphaproteobacteria bacterium]